MTLSNVLIAAGGIAYIALFIFMGIVLWHDPFKKKTKQSTRFQWQEQGEANSYRIKKDGQWFAIIQLNGELMPTRQIEIMRDICRSLNQGEKR